MINSSEEFHSEHQILYTVSESRFWEILSSVFHRILCFSLSLKDEKWSKSFDPKLQGLLSDLESGLGSVVRQSNPENSGKLNVKEEDILGGCWKVLTFLAISVEYLTCNIVANFKKILYALHHRYLDPWWWVSILDWSLPVSRKGKHPWSSSSFCRALQSHWKGKHFWCIISMLETFTYSAVTSVPNVLM